MIYNDKIYGSIDITDPLVLELMQAAEMERLKDICPDGIVFLIEPKIKHNRFQHSVGVWYLLKKFQAPVAEQLSGLLHDVSHKVFSHVIDHLFGSNQNEDHQDLVHKDFIAKSSLKEILEKHNFKAEEIADLERGELMDNELPNLCADRLDYTLRDSYEIGFSSPSLHQEILNDLTVSSRGFVFKSETVAKKFGWLSHKLQTEFWHSAWNILAFNRMADILKYALNKNYITAKDFWLSDHQMLSKLETFNDPEIVKKFDFIKQIKKGSFKEDPNDFDLNILYKCRIVDPWVGEVRLSEVDSKFKKAFEIEKKSAQKGKFIKFLG